nr:DUF3006 domain-containing protein [Deinococcus aestuarii]
MISDSSGPVLTGRLIVGGITEDCSPASLPEGVREGDVLRGQVEDGDLTVEIDHEATRERRQGAQIQLDALNRAARARPGGPRAGDGAGPGD